MDAIQIMADIALLKPGMVGMGEGEDGMGQTVESKTT